MGEIVEAFRALFGKLLGFLDAFGLSFLVSGVVALLALASAAQWLGASGLPKLTGPASLLFCLVAISLAHACGFVCFLTGRALRRWAALRVIPRHSGTAGMTEETGIEPTIRAHGLLDAERLGPYFNEDGRAKSRLHDRLWHDPRRAASLALFNHLRRVAATCDGLAAAALLWLILLLSVAAPASIRHPERVEVESGGYFRVIAPTGAVFRIQGPDGATPEQARARAEERYPEDFAPPPLPLGLLVVLVGVSLIACVACTKEARRSEQCQLEVLAASVAADHPSLPRLERQGQPST